MIGVNNSHSSHKQHQFCSLLHDIYHENTTLMSTGRAKK